MTKIEIFMGFDEQWYWRARNTRNARIVATGAEGYVSKSNAKRAVRRLGVALTFKIIEVINPPTRPGDYRVS